MSLKRVQRKFEDLVGCFITNPFQVVSENYQVLWRQFNLYLLVQEAETLWFCQTQYHCAVSPMAFEQPDKSNKWSNCSWRAVFVTVTDLLLPGTGWKPLFAQLHRLSCYAGSGTLDGYMNKHCVPSRCWTEAIAADAAARPKTFQSSRKSLGNHPSVSKIQNSFQPKSTDRVPSKVQTKLKKKNVVSWKAFLLLGMIMPKRSSFRFNLSTIFISLFAGK